MAHSSSRRALLGGAAALLAPTVAATAATVRPLRHVDFNRYGDPSSAIPATASADAALLTLCARFHALHAEARATDDDDAMHEVMGRRWDASDEIEDIAPRTPEGMRAKASVALALLDENARWDRSGDTQFAYVMLRDLAGAG